MNPTRTGIAYALGAYLLWGFMPIYWKLLSHVPAPLVLAHRIVWSCVFLAIPLAAPSRRTALLQALRDWRRLRPMVLASLLISVNWLTYIWAVTTGHIVEASLGYYINPLLNVALGTLLLRERLRPVQWIPLALAAAGVLQMGLAQGRLPWVALVLATSFGIYGLVKRTTHLDSVTGLSLETALLGLPALGYILVHQPAVLDPGPWDWLLLAGAGPITAVPLLLFAAGARRIELWLTGLLQYLAPTVQLLLGLWLFGETLGDGRLTGFLLVWAGLLLFAGESLWRRRRAGGSA
jgi:chloramphenicol-sensitive protein RarD